MLNCLVWIRTWFLVFSGTGTAWVMGGVIDDGVAHNLPLLYTLLLISICLVHYLSALGRGVPTVPSKESGVPLLLSALIYTWLYRHIVIINFYLILVVCIDYILTLFSVLHLFLCFLYWFNRLISLLDKNIIFVVVKMLIMFGVCMSACCRGWQETKANRKKNIFFSNFNWFLKRSLPSRLIRLPLVSWRNVFVSSRCRWYRHWSWYRVRISKTTTLMWDEALSSETTLTPFNTILKLAVSQGPLVPSNDITPIWSWVTAPWSPCKLEGRDKPVKDESVRLSLFWLLSVPFSVPCSDSALLPHKGNGHSALKGWLIPFFTTCIQNINDLWKTNIRGGEKKIHWWLNHSALLLDLY